MKTMQTLLALALSFATLNTAAAPNIEQAPADPIVYAVEVYDGNRLIFGQDVTAPVGEAVEFQVVAQNDTDVGVVGYVWPIETAPGVVRTRVLVDADWLDLDDPNALTTAWVNEDLPSGKRVVTKGIVSQVGDYQVVVVQKTP